MQAVILTVVVVVKDPADGEVHDPLAPVNELLDGAMKAYKKPDNVLMYTSKLADVIEYPGNTYEEAAEAVKNLLDEV